VEQRKNRIAVDGLRNSNPSTLAVMVDGVLRTPVQQLNPRTFADLMALSEIPEQLPAGLAKSLSEVRDRMMREVADIPDGAPMASFLRDLVEVAPSAQSASLREGLRTICAESTHEDVVPAFEALEGHWATEEPIEIVLPKDPAAAPKAAPAAVRPRRASSAKAASPEAAAPVIEVLEPVDAKPRRRAGAAAVADTRREDWMREDVVSRLKNYGSRGLKQEIIVAGTRHRAPWDDLTEKEVLAILRKMKREGRVRFSAGRWMIS
jgi:hypothetical protein